MKTLFIIGMLSISTVAFPKLDAGRSEKLAALRQYAMGHRLFDERKYEEALIYLSQAAQKNHAGAALILGKMYLYGHGVEKNEVSARTFYHDAARHGNLEAQAFLGQMHYSGCLRNVFPKDRVLAREFSIQAANKGHVVSQIRLGKMCLEGEGGPKDEVLAKSLFSKAAQQDAYEAQYCLSGMYLKGQGGDKNEDLGKKWLRKSADGQYKDAMYDLGMLYLQGHGASSVMGMRHKKELAKVWLTNAAYKGHTGAKEILEQWKDL